MKALEKRRNQNVVNQTPWTAPNIWQVWAMQPLFISSYGVSTLLSSVLFLLPLTLPQSYFDFTIYLRFHPCSSLIIKWTLIKPHDYNHPLVIHRSYGIHGKSPCFEGKSNKMGHGFDIYLSIYLSICLSIQIYS